MSAGPLVRARRSGLLLWLAALLGGLCLGAIHLAAISIIFDSLDWRLVAIDAGLLVLALVPAAWYIRSLSGERRRHAAQVVLVEVIAEPRNIGDAARGALETLLRARIADAGVIALTGEADDRLRVIAALGYPESWAKSAPTERQTGGGPLVHRVAATEPWLEPLRGRLGRRPWVARVPIVSHGDPIGLLFLVARSGGALRDRRVLRSVGAQVGAALGHAALYEASYQRERDLEAQDQRRREFLGAVSHEIRTPLMSIQAFADLLSLQQGALDGAAADMVLSLGSSVERLNRLVTDLIDLGRSGGQEFEVRVTEVDVREPIRRAEAVLRPAIMLREQGVVIDLPEAPLRALADADRLQQVILAVLANANRHAPPGSEITLAARRLEDGQTVRLEIRDNGAGISREDRERIFEPYYRVRGASGETVPGSGLGLAVARRLIEAQGGRIWVEPLASGDGACFCIDLRAPSDHV